MTNFEESVDEVDALSVDKSSNKNKLKLIIIVLIVVIGASVAGFVSMNKKPAEKNPSSKVVSVADQEFIIYDIPDVNVIIKKDEKGTPNLRIKSSIELPRDADLKQIEDLMPKILDAIVSLCSEISTEEVSGSKGFYFLKEEILYRINLITDPIKAYNLNIKSIEVHY